MVILFAPQPAPAELPARFPSPFDAREVHPLARRAAEELMAGLRGGLLDLTGLDEPGRGKMFGVLVVADGARTGYLRAFSGMVAGRWQVDGFAPPVFDEVARDAVWPAGEAELRGFDAGVAALGGRIDAARAVLDDVVAAHRTVAVALRDRHAARRAARHAARAGADAARLHALAQESRGDAAEKRRLELAQAGERAAPEAALAALVAERAALEAMRSARSRELLAQIYDTYWVANARGERRSLWSLFAPEVPPGGAGDCAAPKLLAQAYRLGLRPLALAEFWWGAPPLTGGRHAGVFYPACRGKCGGVLPHMLGGLDAEPVPLYGAERIADDEPRLVHEDPWLLVVDKPCGLLSVPGRHDQLRDSVSVRLGRRYPQALVVHRLDLDTSGLLLVARDDETHAALQRLFARREIDKRYLAWLDGDVAGDEGRVELPLRVDLDDRPRQIVDPVHGKRAVTDWRVLERAGGRTRVALWPRTGRTHQLRVHAAVGLGCPIAGDRLYGRGGGRLLLHAEALAFTHPRTGAGIELVRPAPF